MATDPLALIKTYESVAHLDKGERRRFTAQGPLSSLLFYGSLHVRDAEHPMFGEISKLFDEMQPDLIFIEGIAALRSEGEPGRRARVLQEIAAMPLAEAVRTFGESGFCARYGVERGLAVECPEPLFVEELQHVSKQGFSRDAIVAYYSYRMVSQWLNTPKPPTIEDYMSPVIDEIRKASGWSDYDWSLTHLFSLSEKFWGVPLTLDQQHTYRRGVAPFGNRREGTGSETNEVCSASALFRDMTIAQTIIKAQARAERIAVVYGSGHCFTLQEALTAAFESNNPA